MAKTTSIALGEDFTTFLAEQVATGRYGSASEVVRAGLRLLQERAARLAELRAEIAQGEASGWIGDFDIDVFVRELKSEYAA